MPLGIKHTAWGMTSIDFQSLSEMTLSLRAKADNLLPFYTLGCRPSNHPDRSDPFRRYLIRGGWKGILVTQLLLNIVAAMILRAFGPGCDFPLHGFQIGSPDFALVLAAV